MKNIRRVFLENIELTTRWVCWSLEICIKCALAQVVAIKIADFFSNSNPACIYVPDLEIPPFILCPQSSKNLGVLCQAIERDVAIPPKCPHKNVAKRGEFLDYLR